MEFGPISIQTATNVIILQRIIHEHILKRIFKAEVYAWPIVSACNRHDNFGASTCSHFRTRWRLFGIFILTYFWKSSRGIFRIFFRIFFNRLNWWQYSLIFLSYFHRHYDSILNLYNIAVLALTPLIEWRSTVDLQMSYSHRGLLALNLLRHRWWWMLQRLLGCGPL